MKKIPLLVIAILTFGFINAQEFKFGIKGGLNIANLNGDTSEYEDVAPLIGFHIGGFVDIKLDDKFSIQPELLFSQQGATSSSDASVTILGITTSTEISNETKLNYFTIPVMFKYYATKSFSLEAGPQLGFLASADSKYERKTTTTFVGSTTVTSDLDPDFSSVDFGLNFGAGYTLDSGLLFQARYNLGLSNIYDNDDINVKNGVIQLSIGYKF